MAIRAKKLLTAVGLLAAVAVLQIREVNRLEVTRASERIQIGEWAPDLAVKSAAGQRIDLGGTESGKFRIVSFWASWCLPCKVEMPELARFAREWKDSGETPGLEYVAVNVGERPDDVRAVVDDPRYEQVRFGFDEEARVAESWSVRGFPTTFLVDPEGRVVEAITGYDERIVSRLRRHLPSRTDAGSEPE